MNTFVKISAIFCGAMLLTAAAWAGQSSPFQVLPWNGYKAAFSLTYDDGDPIHLDLVIPEMNKRHLRGTFNLIAGQLNRVEDWKKAVASGQEIGNHTLSHKHTSELTAETEKIEVDKARSIFQTQLGVTVGTLAYPFVEISPGLKKWTEAENFLARGGGSNDLYLTPEDNPDWFNLPSQATMTAYAYETYKNWVDEALADGAWTITMIHAVEGSTWFQPVPKTTFLKLLDYLEKNNGSVWTAPFGEVGAYWRAEKVLESASIKKDGASASLRWDRPANFPSGVVLKVRAGGKGLQVTQGGKAVAALSDGVYPVSFDAGEMTLTNAEWKEWPSASVKSGNSHTAPAVVLSAMASNAPTQAVLKIDDFESAQALYGGTWWEGCDSNGATKLTPNPFSPLAGGSPVTPGHSGGLKGHMGPQSAPWPWAALSLSLENNSKLLDLSAYKSLSFYTQGDGKTHTVALNRASVTDYADFQTNYLSPVSWKKVVIPLAEFAQPNWGKQMDKTFNDVSKITFSPGTGDPDFNFQVDDVEFIK